LNLLVWEVGIPGKANVSAFLVLSYADALGRRHL